jgi:hypothetical protein
LTNQIVFTRISSCSSEDMCVSSVLNTLTI